VKDTNVTKHKSPQNSEKQCWIWSVTDIHISQYWFHYAVSAN